MGNFLAALTSVQGKNPYNAGSTHWEAEQHLVLWEAVQAGKNKRWLKAQSYFIYKKIILKTKSASQLLSERW